jgi:hypothetical protein
MLGLVLLHLGASVSGPLRALHGTLASALGRTDKHVLCLLALLSLTHSFNAVGTSRSEVGTACIPQV